MSLLPLAPFLQVASRVPIYDMDPDRFLQICHEAPNTASGLDNWRPREWKCLPREATTQLARLYDCIETKPTWQWPRATCPAGSVDIPKPDTEELDILTWRHLAVLSTAYRDWAKARLWDLAP